MYEKAGLSVLERVVGESVSAISFVQDYVEVHFEDVIFRCFTWPGLIVSDQIIASGMAGYRDKLCEFIGRAVQSVEEETRRGLYLYFENGDALVVSLQYSDARSVEAAMLNQVGGSIFAVWRYE